MALPKYITNFDELTDDLKFKLLCLIDDEMRSKFPNLFKPNMDLQIFLSDLEQKLPSVKYRKLKEKINDLIIENIDGKQKIKGEIFNIPGIQGDYSIKFKFNKDIFLTGLHFNQTGWKQEDTYSLDVDKNRIIDGSTTKEIGEHKYFNTFYKVNANTPIFFILHNNSGNSRQSLVNLEYVEGTKTTTTVEPPEIPTIEDIKNEWDIAVVMQWEANIDCDMDLHGVIGNKHVFYAHKEEKNFYLNFDTVEHKTNQKPEILSVKGYRKEKLQIYINNFHGVKLKEQVNIKIYNKRSYGNRLLKEINVDSNIDKNILQGICEIDLKTLKIKGLNENIRR